MINDIRNTLDTLKQQLISMESMAAGIDLNPEHGFLAVFTKQKGYAAMTKLLRQLEDFSEQPPDER